MIKRSTVLTVLAAVIVTLGLILAMMYPMQSASAYPGSSPADPIVVTAVTDVPAGAVEDNHSTYNTANTCDTTRSWTHTVPGQDAVTHKEWTAETRTRTITPATAGVKEYEYKKKVIDYKAEYHFSKFTRIKTRTYTAGTPAVKAQHYSLAGGSWKTNATPAFPDPGAPYKWVANTNHEPHGNEVTYPANGTGQHYTSSQGNTNWFYFTPGKAAVPGSWSAWSTYSAWTKWTPETHTSWEDSAVPLGTPQYHSSGKTGNTEWYREWQAQFDGQVRQTASGYHYEKAWFVTNPGSPWVATGGVRYKVEPTAEVVGPWSAWTAYGTNPSLTDPVLPANTRTQEYRKSGPVTVEDSAATEPVVTYYAWTDGKVCDVVTTPPTPEPPVVNPPTPEPPVVTPPAPQPPKKKIKPSVDIRANCTGTVGYVANNTKSNVPVAFKYLNDGKVKSFVVKAGKKKAFTEKADTKSVAWIKTKGDVARTVVPGPCHVPHAGFRK